jgi:hypothetical protein
LDFFSYFDTANCNLWPSSIFVYALCSTSRLHLFRKSALGILCLCPEPSSARSYDLLLYQLTVTGTIAVVELPENTLFLVPFRHERIYAVLLHKVVDTSDFQILVTPRGTSPVFSLSAKYHVEGRLQEKMLDGFYDPGRIGDIVKLDEYQKYEGKDHLW